MVILFQPCPFIVDNILSDKSYFASSCPAKEGSKNVAENDEKHLQMVRSLGPILFLSYPSKKLALQVVCDEAHSRCPN